MKEQFTLTYGTHTGFDTCLAAIVSLIGPGHNFPQLLRLFTAQCLQQGVLHAS
jgi:hypothetical protein